MIQRRLEVPVAALLIIVAAVIRIAGCLVRSNLHIYSLGVWSRSREDLASRLTNTRLSAGGPPHL